MNQFFYESHGKEKVKSLIEEGIKSQALHQTGAARSGTFRSLPKLILMILGLLGTLGILFR
jgi:hypothetical protein